MGLEFVDRTIKMTLLLGFLGFMLSCAFIDAYNGLGFFAGVLWNILNLLLIKCLVQAFFSRPYHTAKFCMALGLKFFLYLIGYCLLSIEGYSYFSLLFGFSLPFIVIIFLALNPLQKKVVLSGLILGFTSSGVYASLESEVPEIPSIFSLIASHFSNSPFAIFLHNWETILFSILIACSISTLFYLSAKRPALIPTPLQNFLELIIDYLRKFVLDILGPEGEKYVPFLGTLFIYILSMNWVVLIPFMKPPTSNLNVTLALALCVFGLVQYLNIKNHGFFGFIYHLAGSPKTWIEWTLVPLMLPIELLTQITRPLTLALRLFGNVLGEDILIGAAALFGVFLLSSFDLAVGLPMQIPFMFLVMLTGLMQALVFTLLTTVYILLSFPHKNEIKKSN